MTLKFITGNKNKFKEIQDLLNPIGLEMLSMDLDEIQDLDPQVVVEHKMKQALKIQSGPFIIEDTSLNFECFDYKLPGTFIKHFQKVFTNQGFYELTQKLGKSGFTGSCIIGYADENNNLNYFRGDFKGEVVSPLGDKDFGFGAILKLEGLNQTLGEVERPVKYEFGARGKATLALKEYLLKNAKS